MPKCCKNFLKYFRLFGMIDFPFHRRSIDSKLLFSSLIQFTVRIGFLIEGSCFWHNFLNVEFFTKIINLSGSWDLKFHLVEVKFPFLLRRTPVEKAFRSSCWNIPNAYYRAYSYFNRIFLTLFWFLSGSNELKRKKLDWVDDIRYSAPFFPDSLTGRRLRVKIYSEVWLVDSESPDAVYETSYIFNLFCLFQNSLYFQQLNQTRSKLRFSFASKFNNFQKKYFFFLSKWSTFALKNRCKSKLVFSAIDPIMSKITFLWNWLTKNWNHFFVWII